MLSRKEILLPCQRYSKNPRIRIVACAVLHNFCILAGDEWDEDDFNDDDDNGPNNNDNVLRDGDDIRELLKNNL